MRTSDLGLITEKGELPVLFGSITFKEHESRYSQPKLKLYSLYRALKAQRHMLYGIHFRIKVNARCRRKNWLVHELTKLRSYDDTTNEL